MIFESNVLYYSNNWFKIKFWYFGIYIFVLIFVLLDIDECKRRIDNCYKDYGFCYNIYGSFICFCKKFGFEGNGVNCKGKYFFKKLLNKIKVYL